jgi:hypothetical protein
VHGAEGLGREAGFIALSFHVRCQTESPPNLAAPLLPLLAVIRGALKSIRNRSWYVPADTPQLKYETQMREARAALDPVTTNVGK